MGYDSGSKVDLFPIDVDSNPMTTRFVGEVRIALEKRTVENVLLDRNVIY